LPWAGLQAQSPIREIPPGPEGFIASSVRERYVVPMKRWLPVLWVGLALVMAAPAQAMRCGTKLVTRGDTSAEVLRNCGEPTEISRRSVWRRPVVWRHGHPFFVGHGAVEVP